MIVVDTNVALSWVLQEAEEVHRYAASVAEAGVVHGIQLVAPQLMAQECAHKLLKTGRRLKWGAAKTAEFGETIDMIGVKLVDVSSRVAAHVRFAQQWHIQGHDAVFLALAMSLRARLATRDGGLITAARRAGVEIFSA